MTQFAAGGTGGCGSTADVGSAGGGWAVGRGCATPGSRRRVSSRASRGKRRHYREDFSLDAAGDRVSCQEAVTRLLRYAALALVLVLPAQSGRAADVPIAGKSLRVSAKAGNPARRTLSFRSVGDPALAAPFPDPAAGALLRVFASNAPGGCRLDAALPAGNWSPIGDDGPSRGWRYLDKSASVAGVRKIVVKPGRLVVKAKGSALPCGLEAPAQSEPIGLDLVLDDTRYCAAFGGDVTRNDAGRFRARDAAPPATCLDRDVTIANLNVLHGLFCPPATSGCRLADRIDLLGEWIVARGCPDVVALQEVSNTVANPIPDLVEAHLADVCPAPYEVLFLLDNGVDDSLILSRHPALSSAVTDLLGPLRNVLHVRLDHPVGPIDVYSTHLASGSDLASSPCEGTFGPCPAECVAAGAATVRQCQAEQTALLVEATHDVPEPAFLVGDMNASPASFEITRFTGRGWIDAYAAAGNPACVPATGVGCTSGREDSDLSELEDPALNVGSRIDYVFLVPESGGACNGTLDTPADADGDGTGTRLFAEAPNPFAPTCGALPDPICWVSDHTGVEADLDCH